MPSKNAKFVMLDRDGVINRESDAFIKHPAEWLPMPGSLEAITELFRHGYRIIVITNQSGISRGLLNLETLENIHRKMREAAEGCGAKIDAVYFCPHGPDDACDCRKPKPGLLRQFASEYQISLENIPFIGDSYRDIQAGLAAGARPFLVKTGKGRRTLAAHPEISVPIFENLYDAAQFIISGQ